MLYKISVVFLISSFVLNINAQELERKQISNENQDYKILKRIQDNSISEIDKPKKTVSVEESNIENTAASQRLSSEGSQGTYSASVPATKKVANSTKNSIQINNNPNIPIIDNLVSLIEEKKAVNESNNQTLLNSSDYQSLNNLIQQERAKFDIYVSDKGIENCSIKEQNYYLSFLKEEGREQEYLDNINKIK
jgi:hypothetical protein